MSDCVKTTVDPLLKDLDGKKESFRRNVVSMAAELKQVRGRLVSQEQSFLKETLFRKEAEKKAKDMEMEICKLQKKLEDRNCELEASTSAAEKFLEEVDDLRSQLALTKEIEETSAASAQSAQLQCSVLKEQFDDKTRALREHEDRVTELGHQLDNLQRDVRARECSQKQLREEVMRIEHEITEAVAKSGKGTECELRKLLEEVSPRNFERMNKLLAVKDEEIAKLKDDVKLMSAHWKLKTKELESQVQHPYLSLFSCSVGFPSLLSESFNLWLINEHFQLERQRRADQELKKKVLKLEFCLQEARSQTRKLQRAGERRDKAIKELRDQITGKQLNESVSGEKPNFWDTSGFKIAVSMSMLLLVIVSKR
ncbi:nuclear envelope-associated protein 2 isoform X1 [Capsella rubella]|uniref:nuclear envelope-associated protein 2 isoform X1 n=1 Tax=Capsella rubella TaxID=81985 RepID=UPI000CD544B4|nr:nuclear envelope-associated protein 2 isoform X1 [Capsella rubella]